MAGRRQLAGGGRVSGSRWNSAVQPTHHYDDGLTDEYNEYRGNRSHTRVGQKVLSLTYVQKR